MSETRLRLTSKRIFICFERNFGIKLKTASINYGYLCVYGTFHWNNLQNARNVEKYIKHLKKSTRYDF